jgi:hypothetical protein
MDLFTIDAHREHDLKLVLEARGFICCFAVFLGLAWVNRGCFDERRNGFYCNYKNNARIPLLSSSSTYPRKSVPNSSTSRFNLSAHALIGIPSVLGEI